MRTIRSFGIVVFLSLLAACSDDALPSAELSTQGDFACRGTLGRVTKDNIVVPNGATCTLSGTRAEGNIIVKTGATLTANGVRVDGNIQAEGHKSVVVRRDSRVKGDIQIKQGASARALDTVIGGNLQVEQNRGTFIFARNLIDGDLQAKANRGGGLTIKGNRIGGNLQCESNNPAPVGGNNRASDKEGQCSRL